jgi:hypothetical protein
MSRHFVRLSCVVTMLAIAPLTLAATQWREGGYASLTSVPQGGTISFHIATGISPFTLEIVNLAHPTQVLATVAGLTSTQIDCTGLWENGCGWPVTTQFTVPAAWPSGFYAARFPTTGGTRQSIFVVKNATPGTTSPIAVVSATNTYQAYNQFGGKSVYDSISTDGQRAHIVSFRRPYFDNLGLGRYPAWEQQFVDFMTAENRPFEVITDDDLADPSILGHYRLVLLVGHSEYWTRLMRENLEAYVHAGGNVAVFGGNTMWWQARVDLAQRQFTVYKSAALDPMNGVDNDVVTVNWYDYPLFHPENFILGSSFRHGGYANVIPGGFEALPVAQRTPYTVVDASSWVFDGTGLTNGGTFGQASAGTEVDGVVFNTLPTGELRVDGSDGTPLNFHILATIPGEEGYGVIGYYVHENFGVVFNAGTRDWTRGLPADAAVQQITRNVLDELSAAQPLPHDTRTSPWITEDFFNTPLAMAGVLPGWSGNLREASVAASCALEGPTGLRMEGADWTQLIRNFAPDNAGSSAAVVRFQLNADGLTGTPTFAMPIVELIDEVDEDITVYAAVEMRILPAGKSIRLALYDAAGDRSGTTPWAVMPSGWQPVVLSWSSPGRGILRVGDSMDLEVVNPHSGQQVRELMLEFAGSGFGATGSLCIDAMQLRDSIDLPPAPETSIVTASPASIVADGTSSSTITVQLRDGDGTDLTQGGDAVTITTTHGMLTGVTDHGDGTYTAILTASTIGTATIYAGVHGSVIDDDATVTATAGPAATFELTAPPNAVAGTPFSVTVTARDAQGNVASGYTGTIHFTSTDPAATLPADTTFVAANNGVRTFVNAITLRSGGARTITVTDASITGSANVQVTLPAPATLDASPVTTTKITVSWSAVANATSYRVERSFNNGPFTLLTTTSATSIDDLTVTANKSYLYRVAAVDGLTSAVDVATTIVFVSDPQRIMRASHVNDLRTGINVLRTTAGLPAAVYSRGIEVGNRVKASDLTEMRTAVNAARTALGLPAYPYAETIAVGGVIRWSHWRELQMAIGALPAAP